MTTKRILFIFLCVVSFLSASAQPNIEYRGRLRNGNGASFAVIPKIFCKDNTPLIISEGRSIYDGDLNLVCTIKGVYPKELIFRDYDDGTYFSIDKYEKFVFTQTLFNDDEHFEYIVKCEIDGVSGYYVINDEGTVVMYFGKEFIPNLIKINGNFYFIDYNGFFYKLNREGAESGTNKVSVSRAEDIGETRYFGLSGQEVNPQSTSEKIIIKTDGKKSVKVVNR